MTYPRYERARAHRKMPLASLSPNVTAITEFATFSGGPGTGGYDVSLEAQVGDEMEVRLVGRMMAVAVYVGFDVYSIVAGAQVNPFGDGLSVALGSNGGIQSALVPNTAQAAGFMAMATRTIAAGDIENGRVKMRLYTANSGATAREFRAGVLYARNLGPFDPE